MKLIPEVFDHGLDSLNTDDGEFGLYFLYAQDRRQRGLASISRYQTPEKVFDRGLDSLNTDDGEFGLYFLYAQDRRQRGLASISR